MIFGMSRTSYVASIKHAFYSLCRNVNEYNITDKCNEFIENNKDKYVNNGNSNYYYSLIKYLSNNVLNKNLTPEEAIIILINIIDPDFEIYQMKDNKNELIEKYYFYDKTFLDYEEKYIKFNSITLNKKME